MTDRIRTKLIELARQRTTWSYTQLNDQLELGLAFSNPGDREYIGELLGEITTHEFERGRPLLSCLITHQMDCENKVMDSINFVNNYFNKIGLRLNPTKNGKTVSQRIAIPSGSIRKTIKTLKTTSDANGNN